MSLRFVHGIFAILLGFTLACCVAVYHTWMQDNSVPSDRAITTWSPPQTKAVAATTEVPDATGYVETFARPIFTSTRRPFEPPKVEVVAPPQEEVVLMPVPEVAPVAVPDASRVVLKGVRLNAGQRQALLFSDTAPQAQWLSIGNNINGFQLVAIDDDSVTLEAGAQKVEINLYAKKPVN